MSVPPLLIATADPNLLISLGEALSNEYRLLASSSYDRIDTAPAEPVLLAVIDLSSDSLRPVVWWERVLDSLSKMHTGIKLILLSEPSKRDDAFELVRSGRAYDVILKPVDGDLLALALRRARYLAQLESELRVFEIPKSHESLGELIGDCEQMRAVFATIQKTSNSSAHCLLMGENGTGKLSVAQALHELRGLERTAFMEIHGSLDPRLIHEQLNDITLSILGMRQKASSPARAFSGKGSVFIGDVDQLPPIEQLQLLRMVEAVDSCRLTRQLSKIESLFLVTATSENLAEQVKAGRFRQDLYYRLAEIEIHLPPLRERGDDIIGLADHMLQQISYASSKSVQGFHRSAIGAMLTHQWPGNIDELQNRVRGAIVRAESSVITASDLGLARGESAPVPVGGKGASQFSLIRGEAEKDAVESALKQCNWNVSKTARLLGISRPTLYEKIQRFGLSFDSQKTKY